ncbi:MAG: phospholipase D-like domain-containing protein [Bacteroidota bacterium]
MKRRTIFAVTILAAALAGCQANYSLLSTSPSRYEALDVEIPLDQMPTEKLYVPKVRSRAPQSPTFGNGATIYVSPKESYPALKEMIRDAKESIYLETFSFAYDEMGKELAGLLIDKAKSGLEVKVLMDYVGSRFAPDYKELLKALRAGGVEAQVYRPRAIVKDDEEHSFNITHRKVYLADGEVALIGGVNLHAPFHKTVQDVLIHWQGPIVNQLYNEFSYDWHAAKGGTLRQTPHSVAVPGGIDAQLTVTSPPEGRFETRDLIYSKIDGAKREIVIENQYLWDDRLITRLHAAVRRGVKLRMMVPGQSHGALFRNIHSEELNNLIKEGAEAKLYHGIPADAHLHVKYFSIDDQWATIGSTNGDTRGFQDNQELNVSFTDPAKVVELRQRLFEHDWTQSSEPFVYKKASLFTKPFRKILEAIDYYL